MNIIQEQRVKYGWTQEHFGEILGYKKNVGRTMVCGWERNKKLVPRNKLILVAMLLNISVVDILKEEKK